MYDINTQQCFVGCNAKDQHTAAITGVSTVKPKYWCEYSSTVTPEYSSTVTPEYSSTVTPELVNLLKIRK